MSEDEKKTGVSVGIQPLLIQVPVLTEADLLELVAAIDEAQAAHVRLRSKTRAVLRKAQAALDRWSLPASKEPEAGPALRLVSTEGKKRQR